MVLCNGTSPVPPACTNMRMLTCRACPHVQDGLVAVPTAFFQSSLALGNLMQVCCRIQHCASPWRMHLGKRRPDSVIGISCRPHIAGTQQHPSSLDWLSDCANMRSAFQIFSDVGQSCYGGGSCFEPCVKKPCTTPCRRCWGTRRCQGPASWCTPLRWPAGRVLCRQRSTCCPSAASTAVASCR